MHSLHHSRGRILFEVACAFGIAASCVWAWMQTYSTAMLPAAAIAALYGLVHAFDMVRRSPKAVVTADAVELPANQGDLLDYLATGESEPVTVEEPKFAESPVEAVAETRAKRSRKSPKLAGSGNRSRRDRQVAEPVVAVAEQLPEPERAEVAPEAAPEAPEPTFEPSVTDNAPAEPEYVPTTPLFEAEPFVRQQRAAFGRRGR